MLSSDIREAALVMRYELERNRLEVVLVPLHDPDMALRGGKIRVAVSHNPAWYRELCEDYPKRRSKPRQRKKPDTAIKRAHVLRALTEIYETGEAGTDYGRRLLPYIEKRNKQYMRGEW